MSHTYTRTFNAITPANPYLRCCVCGAPVEFWLDKPGPLENEPCGHEADYRNICPSWGPVYGCECSEPHDPLPAPTTPDHPVSPAHGDLGRHSEGQER